MNADTRVEWIAVLLVLSLSLFLAGLTGAAGIMHMSSCIIADPCWFATDVTVIKLSDSLAALERQLAPKPDPRHMADARRRLVAAVDGVVASLARGEEPNNEVGRWIVAHDGDVAAALEALIELRRAAAIAHGRAANRVQR